MASQSKFYARCVWITRNLVFLPGRLNGCSSWGDIYRRPSHADKCAALRKAVLRQTFFVSSDKNHKIRKFANRSKNC